MIEYIIVALIGTIGSLAGIQLLQRNWFKREDLKFKYDVKRAKLRQKGSSIKKSSTPTSPIDWLNELKKVNPDTLHDLIDTFGGSDEERGGDITDTLATIVKSNPEIVEKFLSNMGKGNKEEKYLG